MPGGELVRPTDRSPLEPDISRPETVFKSSFGDAAGAVHLAGARLPQGPALHPLIAAQANVKSNKELDHYTAPVGSDDGVLSLYRDAGLDVRHLPADDPAHDLTARSAFEAAVDHLSEDLAQRLVTLPLPAVLHCSAAIDRSPPVGARVAFLALVGAL